MDGAHPIGGLSTDEAAEILGVARHTVYGLIARGVLPKATKHARHGLDRADVERVSLERYKPGRPYWVTSPEAAVILQVARSRVGQLRESGRLPFVEHEGRYFYRRHQVEVVANARLARREGGHGW